MTNTDTTQTITVYTSPTRFPARHCHALATELQNCAPADIAAAEREALDAVVLRADEVVELMKLRERTAPLATKAPRFALAGAWSGLHDGLNALRAIPVDVSPVGAAAGQLVDSLFPQGLAFVQNDARALWGHSTMMLERIDEESLAARIDALVNPAVLASVRHAHAALAQVTRLALGATATPSTRGLAEALSRFAFSVSAYARACSLKVDPVDPATLRRFTAALAPIDTYRITRSDSDDEDLDPVDPVVDPTPPSPGGPTPPPFG